MGHVHRRRFMTTIGALLAGPLSRAQQAGRTYRVAIVHTTTRLGALAGPNPEHTLTRLILHELRDLGYVEGRNLIFDRRSAEGDLGFELQPVVAHPSDPEVSFARIMQLRVDGMLVEATSTNYGHRKQLGRLAYEARLPSIDTTADAVEAGGLMSYGPSADHIRRVAHYIDKIFKGAQPGDLPMEMATKRELVINLKTAKAIGITIPQSVLLQAARLIE